MRPEPVQDLHTLALEPSAALSAHYASVRARLGVPRPVARVRPGVAKMIKALPPPAPPLPPPGSAPIGLICDAAIGGAARIIKLVALKHGLRPADLTGPSRSPDIVRARHEAIYLVHTHVPHLSLKRIGNRFGGRDHTTVIAAIRGHKRRMKEAAANDGGGA